MREDATNESGRERSPSILADLVGHAPELGVQPRIQELEQQLRSTEKDSERRVDVLNDLAWEIWPTDLERASRLTQESTRIAGALGYERGMAYARRNLGLEHYFRSEVEQALACQSQALEWFEDHEDIDGQASVQVALAYLHWGFGNLQQGLDAAFRSLKLYREIDNPAGQAWTLNALGSFYYDLEDYKQAQDYFQQARGLFCKIRDRMGEARTLNGLGNTYLRLNDCAQALELQQTSLKIHEAIGNRLGASRALNDLGGVYRALNRYQQALEYHRASLTIRQEAAYSPGETTSMLDIGEILLEQEKPTEAQEILDRALALSTKIKAKPKMCRAHRLLSRAFELDGQLEQALDHFRQFHELEEKVFHEKADRKLRNLEVVYQMNASKKEAEIFRLKNVELREKNSQLEETVQRLHAAQAQLVHTSKMAALGNLIAGIVHEINTPIGTIKSGTDIYHRGIKRLVEALGSGPTSQAANRERLERALEVLGQNHTSLLAAANRVEEIVASLKRFVRLDEAELKKTDINEDLCSTLTLIGHQFKERVRVHRHLGPLPEIYSFPGELNQVFMNLLLNAAQAIPQEGTITVRTWASRETHAVQIQIADSGKGIPEDRLPQLFEPGFSEGSDRIRMRTGLFTSYNIIQRHQGDIQVESKEGRGTTFTITLPDNLEARIHRT